jgi:hypothetical protein
MKTIILNGKILKISESEERALKTLKYYGWSSKKDKFVEGSRPRYQNTIIPHSIERRKDLGITEVSQPKTKREIKFFKNHSRCKSGIFGNPRRINAILEKLEEKKKSNLSSLAARISK